MSEMEQKPRGPHSQPRLPVGNAPADPAREPLHNALRDAFLQQQEQIRAQVDYPGRLASVLAIQQEIRSREPQLEEVLSLVTERSVAILGATGSAVALQRDGAMVCRASGGATAPDLGTHLSGDAGLAGECLRTGRTVRCADTQSDPRLHDAAAGEMGIRSAVVVPLYHHRTTVGVLEVFSSKPNFFGSDDAHLVELLGGLITAAVSYSSEFEAKQALQSERTALLQVIEQITPTIEKLITRQQGGSQEEEGAGDEIGAAEINALAQTLSAQWSRDDRAEATAGDSGLVAEDQPAESSDNAFSADEYLEEAAEDVETPPARAGFDPYRSDRFAADNAREQQALDSAVEILLSKENILVPEDEASQTRDDVAQEPADGLPHPEPAEQPAPRKPGRPGLSVVPPLSQERRPSLPPLLPSKPAGAADTEEDDPFQEEPRFPEQLAARQPYAPPASRAATAVQPVLQELSDLRLRDPFSPPRRTEVPSFSPASSAQNSASGVPADVAGGSTVTSRGATAASAGAVSGFLGWLTGPNSGAPRAKDLSVSDSKPGSRGGDAHLSLKWRNLVEYVVPAVLTGLLIVIGLQWLNGRKPYNGPYFLGMSSRRAPEPSALVAPLPGIAPVEISSLHMPSSGSRSAGAGRAGSDIGSKIGSYIAERQPSKDWGESVKKLGQGLARLPVAAPQPATSSNSPVITGIENLAPPKLPSTGNAVTVPLTQGLPLPSAPAAQALVSMPEEIIDDFLLIRVQPIYPTVAQAKNITGVVVLKTRIASDGTVKEVRAVSGNKYLSEAALAAVSQWRYKPFVLNGKPVEIGTEIRIAFKRQR